MTSSIYSLEGNPVTPAADKSSGEVWHDEFGSQASLISGPSPAIYRVTLDKLHNLFEFSILTWKKDKCLPQG